MMQTLADPEHPERDALLEWLGEDFDPKAFDKDRINAALGKSKP